jgi:lipoprotein NlpD
VRHWLHQHWLIGICALLLTACGSQPIASGTYTVKPGDTLYSIAARNNVELRELAKLNNIGNDFRIYPGQVLRLSAAIAKPQQVDKPARAAAAVPKIVVAPPSNIKWNWPASSTTYAATTRPNGGVGLIIKGRLGQDINAAAAGRVVYTGSGLLGYGQLIIIKHDDVYLSAYGHTDSVLVHEGDQVTANQKIAIMSEGPNSEPMLYFEIRVNGQPTDPLAVLPRASSQQAK